MNKAKILLAEDSPAVLEYFRTMLVEEGYDVITAVDGLDAVEKFFRHLPHLVVTDVEMPVMNGYHVCRLIKNEPETSRVPFIMLTSLTEARYKYWGLEVGADRYVLKEEAEEKLLPTVKELLVQESFDPAGVSQVDEQFADSSHILDRLNWMLDNKLFRMTLTNTITGLAFKDVTLNDLAAQILETLLNIVHVQSLAITLLNTEEIRFYVHASEPLTADYIEAFSFYSLEYLEEWSRISLDHSKFDLEYFCDLSDKDEPVFSTESNHNFFRRISDELQMSLHLVPMPGIPIQQESLDLVEFLIDYISITMVHTFMHEKIKSLSVIDSLTRLYNKGHFLTLLNAEYRRSIRHNLDLSLIFLDIDKFKDVNDTYGHLSGDMVLKALAETMLSTIRKSDVAGRYGGEEFVIYLPETKLENAAILADRLRRNVEKRVVPVSKTHSLSVSISLGVAHNGEIDPAEDVEHLLDVADKKLYQAKQEGRNRVVS